MSSRRLGGGLTGDSQGDGDSAGDGGDHGGGDLVAVVVVTRGDGDGGHGGVDVGGLGEGLGDGRVGD